MRTLYSCWTSTRLMSSFFAQTRRFKMFRIRVSFLKRNLWKQLFSQIKLSEKLTYIFRDKKILRNSTLNLPADRKLLTSSATPTAERRLPQSSYGIGLQATFHSPRFAFLQTHFRRHGFDWSQPTYSHKTHHFLGKLAVFFASGLTGFETGSTETGSAS